MPSHNLHHVVSMFSFQGTSELIRSKKASDLSENFVQRTIYLKRNSDRPRSGHLNSSFFTFHFSFEKWRAKVDSLFCGKATAVTTCHRHVVKSRLSSPLCFSSFEVLRTSNALNSTLEQSFLVGQSGLEPPTSRLSVVCSSQLSYWPSSNSAFATLRFRPLLRIGRKLRSAAPFLLSNSNPLRWALNLLFNRDPLLLSFPLLSIFWWRLAGSLFCGKAAAVARYRFSPSFFGGD